MGNIISSLKRRVRRRRAARRRRHAANFDPYREGVLREVTEKSLLEDSSHLGQRQKTKSMDNRQYWRSPFEDKAHIQPVVYSICVNRDLGIGEITSLCHRFRYEDCNDQYYLQDDEEVREAESPDVDEADAEEPESPIGEEDLHMGCQSPEHYATNITSGSETNSSDQDDPGSGLVHDPDDMDDGEVIASPEDVSSDDATTDSHPDTPADDRALEPRVYVSVESSDVNHFPDFVTPFLNKDVRIRLQFHKAVHSTFHPTYSKYEPIHLWKHVKYIDARFLCHPLQNRIKIMLEESHGNRRKPFGTSRRSRPLFPRAIIVNTSPRSPGLYVAGKEFSVMMGPPPDGYHFLDDGRELYAMGTYVRYLDTDRNYLMLWRVSIIEESVD